MNIGNRLVILLAAALFAVPTSALAQGFSTGQDLRSGPVWEQFDLDKDKRIKLTFRKASIDMVLEMFSRESGVTIVKDPKLTDKVTIISPNAVSLADAFAILNAQLKLMGFELKKDDKIMVIEARQSRGGGMDANAIREAVERGGSRQVQTELKVYRIKYANASEVSRVVNDVFLQQEQSRNPFQFFGGRSRGRGSSRWSGFGGQQGQTGPSVRASSDDFSNTVIVNAPHDKQLEVAILIEEIDQQTETPQSVKVYPLQFAFAEDLVPTIQTVMAANQPTGRGGRGQQGQSFFDRISRLRNNVTDGGSVVADSRTNSLVVTSTDQNHGILAQVISELDHDVPYADTTFVFPLDNARAESVADLLNQAFTQRNTGRRNTGSNLNRGNNRGGNNRNRGGGGDRGQRSSGYGGRGVEEDPNFLMLDLEDPDMDVSEFMTMVTIAGGIEPLQQTQGSLGRGAAGQVINTLQVQGQVTIIADPNTNSLIVIGSPEIAEMVRNLLAQLDKVPEQVMIETIIVEATLDSSMKLGVEWNMVTGKFLGNTGVTGTGVTDFGLAGQTPAAEGFRYTISGGNLGGFLNALETDDRFRVLATPRIFTSNNVEAVINISQSIPFIVSQREDVSGNFIFNYSFQDVGIVLTVTPRITANGMVTLDVTQTADDLVGFTDFNAPIVNQRQASTTVSVMDGETIVLGGIMRTQVRTTVKKIPILGDIPILGELFKFTDRQDVKTELLVFLTPRIVRTWQQAEELRKDQVDQLSDRSKADYEKVRPPKTGGGGGNDTGKGNGNGK